MGRHNYYKRNIFWSLVVEMVHRGRSTNEAIDTIYQAYGYKTSITHIIKKLQEDKKIITDSSFEGVFQPSGFSPHLNYLFFYYIYLHLSLRCHCIIFFMFDYILYVEVYVSLVDLKTLIVHSNKKEKEVPVRYRYRLISFRLSY